MPHSIKTSRLSLRAFDSADIDRFTDMANDFAICSMTLSLAYPFTKTDAKKWLLQQQTLQNSSDHYVFAIKEKTSGLVGMIGLDKNTDGLFELGYWVGTKYWGRGYASESVLAILSWAEHFKQIKAITAGYFQDNQASARVLEKSGFLRTGVRTMRYSKGRGCKVQSIGMIWLGSSGVASKRGLG